MWRAGAVVVTAAFALYLLIGRLGGSAVGIGGGGVSDLYRLAGGETVAIRSLATGQYLALDVSSGYVRATSASAADPASQWRVLLLDVDTVAALMRSANSIDAKSEKFTGRRMVSASGCKCTGFSNAHGLGRFCHPWEDANQEAWCYVADNCTSATSRGSFGRRYESCDAPPDDSANPYLDENVDDYQRYQQSLATDERGRSVLVPASGCNCSGYRSSLGFGAYCSGWEYAGQAPWCYVSPSCAQGGAADRWARSDQGSFGQPFEQCVWRAPEDSQPATARRHRRLRQMHHGQRPHAPQQTSSDERSAAHGTPRGQAAVSEPSVYGRRLGGSSRLSSLLASAPELERYMVLISTQSNTFLNVEPPPHTAGLQLTARSDELSIRAIFSTFEKTKLILALGTNSLLNVCDEQTGDVCTGTRHSKLEPFRLLRMPRRTARWAIEVAYK